MGELVSDFSISVFFSKKAYLSDTLCIAVDFCCHTKVMMKSSIHSICFGAATKAVHSPLPVIFILGYDKY
jgi:hypothetical protein